MRIRVQTELKQFGRAESPHSPAHQSPSPAPELPSCRLLLRSFSRSGLSREESQLLNHLDCPHHNTTTNPRCFHRVMTVQTWAGLTTTMKAVHHPPPSEGCFKASINHNLQKIFSLPYIKCKAMPWTFKYRGLNIKRTDKTFSLLAILQNILTTAEMILNIYLDQCRFSSSRSLTVQTFKLRGG